MRTGLNKLMLMGIVSIALLSCKKDEVKTVLNIGTVPTLSASGATLVLLQANANNNAVTFTYTEASFGFDASISYELQISKGGTSFASASTTPVALSKTSPFTKTFKVVDLNKELLKIINYGIATQIEVRVKASVGAAATPAYSNVVTMTITAYRDLITYDYPNSLNIAGNFQGWNPGAAPQICNAVNGGYTNLTNNKYEGYIVFNDPSPQFKMVKGNNWGAGDFGSAGGSALGNGGPNLTLPAGGPGLTGLYRVRADIASLTWSYDKINTWGIIGAFNGWGSSVPLTYNAGSNTWSITRDMPTGEFKFRANDDWGINFGDGSSSTPADGKPDYDGNNLNITVAGNYTITLDISAGGNYAYVLKKN